MSEPATTGDVMAVLESVHSLRFAADQLRDEVYKLLQRPLAHDRMFDAGREVGYDNGYKDGLAARKGDNE